MEVLEHVRIGWRLMSLDLMRLKMVLERLFVKQKNPIMHSFIIRLKFINIKEIIQSCRNWLGHLE